MVKKLCYLNHLKFLARTGTSSESEVTAQEVGARELKLDEDFTGIQGNGSKFTARKSSSMLFLISQN